MATEVTSSNIDTILSRLPSLASQASHSEIYNIDITESENPAVRIIAAKYLKANNNDIEATLKAIEDTLKWRKEFNPRKAAYEETFDDKFDGIGYNTVLGDDVVVWNIYGALQDRKNPAELFEPVEDFIRWRIGLMERCIDLLKLSEYTGDGTADDRQAIQIHDYMRVSMFRMDSNQRAVTKQVVDLMSKHYPESMKAKYMVNVPFIMSWVMTFVKTFISREILKKITVMSYGSGLAEYIGHRDILPKEYGGQSDKSLKDLSISAGAP